MSLGRERGSGGKGEVPVKWSEMRLSVWNGDAAGEAPAGMLFGNGSETRATCELAMDGSGQTPLQLR